MANTIKIKRSAVQGKIPLTTDLQLGELAINTNDGKLYLKKDNGAESIVEISQPISTTQAEMQAGTESNLRSMSPLGVAQAIAALAPVSKKPTFRAFTSSDTWNRPTGCTAIYVELWGGGGGGGGTGGSGTSGPGGGGGCGEYKSILINNPSASYTVTIGAGGTAGPTGNNNAGPGGNTSFGSALTAAGGRFGISGYTSSAYYQREARGETGRGLGGAALTSAGVGNAAEANTAAGGGGGAKGSGVTEYAGGQGGSGYAQVIEFYGS